VVACPVAEIVRFRAVPSSRVFKRRYRISIASGLIAELDVYEGVRAGLRVVEVEFSSESQARAFMPPPWFGQEVTQDVRYTNAELAG